MSVEAVKLGKKKKGIFIDKIKELLPEGGNLNLCLTCGGGGFLQSGFTDARRQYGELKLRQILATKADYCIAACHNCHAQIHDLAEHNGAEYHTVHLWSLICLSLGILGENEREYLGQDLKEVAVYGA